MAGKIIPINNQKELSAKGLKQLQSEVAKLTIDDIDSVTIIYSRKNQVPTVAAYGMDFQILGMAQAILVSLSQDMLVDCSPVDES